MRALDARFRSDFRSAFAHVLSVGVIALAGCPAPSTPDASDARLDADAASDVVNDTSPADVCPMDPPAPTGPGSTAALLTDLCAGRARTGPATRFSPFMGDVVNVIHHTDVGDLEAAHLVVTAPVRIERLRIYVKGMTGGSMRIHLTDDYGRSQPADFTADPNADLITPIPISYTADGWIDIPLCHPVDLHPARHAWIVAEHVTEPMGLAYAHSDGMEFRSFFNVQYFIQQNQSMPGSDGTFQWFQIADGMGNRFEYMAEAYGELICPRTGATWFSDATAGAGLATVTSGDSNWIDIDGDGWEDVGAVAQTMTHEGPAVFRNQRNGTFVPYTGHGLETVEGRTITYADWDGDGHVDLYAGVYKDGLGPFTPANQSRIYMQDATGMFNLIDAPMEPAGPTAATALGDCDRDGHLDLFVGQWDRTYPTGPAPSFFFHGAGDGHFTDITAMAGFPSRPNYPTYGAALADWNNDGNLDLFVAHYGGFANYALRNDGHCNFTDVSVRINIDSDHMGQPGISFGHEFGDYDNDGDLDIYQTCIAHPRYDPRGTDHSRLLNNGGAPNFVYNEVTQSSGIIYTEGEISSAWGDYDNDGDLDLYVSITYPYEFSRLYRNDSGFFTDVTYLAGMATTLNGRGRWYDYDRDGDLDFLTVPAGSLQLFRNDLPSMHHWIEVRLRATGTNPQAIGGRIYATTSDGTRRMRDVFGTETHHGAQGPLVQHFGLGDAMGGVALEVHWPDGTVGSYPGVAPDHVYGITEGQPPQIASP